MYYRRVKSQNKNSLNKHSKPIGTPAANIRKITYLDWDKLANPLIDKQMLIVTGVSSQSTSCLHYKH